MKYNITAKDIAKYCGVSQATVSYVINNRSNQKISDETRKKVLEAIEVLHYVPNASARNMRNHNCTSIGIVCARDYSRQAFLNSLMGISRHLETLDYTITIFNEENECPDENVMPSYIKSYFSNLIDGLIYISNRDHDSFIEPAVKNHVPYVVICMDGVFSKRSPAPHGFDDVLAECARFCRDRSLHSIRYFSVENGGLLVNHKFPVFKTALEDLDPACQLEHVVCSAKNRDFEEMSRFLHTYVAENDFDIAISQNYDIGLILQRAILEKDFVIPQRTKNIFLNYVNFYEMTYPSITGILVPYDKMGEYAARLIMAVINREEEQFSYEEFPCTLQHRESTL